MHLRSFSNCASLLFLGLAIFLFCRCPSLSSSSSSSMASEEGPKSIYDFTVKDIQGNDVSLRKYGGKVVLIVNVASKCGLTQSNYKELNALYEKYKNQGFEIIAFPCNQFAWQEPGTNEEIQETVCTRFKAEFPIFDKTDVNGKNAAPLYKFLKSETGGLITDAIKWNFTKFLVNKEGWIDMLLGPLLFKLRKISRTCSPLLEHPGRCEGIAELPGVLWYQEFGAFECML